MYTHEELFEMVESGKKIHDLRDHLFIYKGGGSSGCFWEWNFAFIDKHGKFHDVESSGCNGCPTKDKLIEKILEYREDWYTKSKRFEILDAVSMTDSEDIEYFVKEYNAGHVRNVAQWLASNVGLYLTMPCEQCGCVDEVTNMYHSGYRGNGGIGIEMEGLICSGCSHDNAEWYSVSYMDTQSGEVYEDGYLDNHDIDSDRKFKGLRKVIEDLRYAVKYQEFEEGETYELSDYPDVDAKVDDGENTILTIQYNVSYDSMYL